MRKCTRRAPAMSSTPSDQIVYGNPIVKAQICTKMRVFSERPALLSVHVDTYMISVSCPCQCWVSNKNNFYRVCEFVKRCQKILGKYYYYFLFCKAPFEELRGGGWVSNFPKKTSTKFGLSKNQPERSSER